jgi:hypothetical protein
MTHATSVSTVARAGSGGCRCGCGGCTSGVCHLECLVRPRFSCGQLLTDQDLDQLVQWARGRQRLQRFRDGWGVVCGLDVSASPEATKPATVNIGPGYAISCCGDDIVVCDGLTLDLTSFCGPAFDPCGDPCAPPPARPDQDAGATTSPTYITLDLFIQYHEQHTDPQTAFMRGGCNQTVACEYTRTRETATLVARAAIPQTATADAVKAWMDQYNTCINDLVLRGFNAQAFGVTASITDKSVLRRMREWFADRLLRRPPRRFPLLAAQVAGLDAKESQSPADIARLLFLLAIDCQDSCSAPCPACDDQSGVPLARVWLKPSGEGRLECRIAAIDSCEPHRRNLSLDTLPALPGLVNLAPYRWRDVHEVRSTLERLGYEVADVARIAIDTPDNVLRALTANEENMLARRLTPLTLGFVEIMDWEGVPFNGERFVRLTTPPA